MAQTYPVSITWTWKVTGEYDTSKLSAGTAYVVELPLTLNGDSRNGWTDSLTFDLTPPQGAKPSPNTVYPQSLPLKSYQNFPFPSFTAQGSGNVRFTATTTQSANLPSALVVADSHATIKGTNVQIAVSISWTWSVTGKVKGTDLSTGTTYEIEIPLKLTGKNQDGWTNPLSLHLQLPPSQNSPPPNTVYPKDILDTYKNFAFPQFTAQGTEDIEIAADTAQAANLPSSLLVADQIIKLKEAA